MAMIKKKESSTSKARKYNNRNNKLSKQRLFYGQRNLIVIVNREMGLRITKKGFISTKGKNIASLNSLLSEEDVIIRQLFGLSEERFQNKITTFLTNLDKQTPDLSVYYKIDAPDKRLDDLAKRLLEEDSVQAAYIKPPDELPIWLVEEAIPLEEQPPSPTPNFVSRQLYLDPAPNGIDAFFAWGIPGGLGNGVNVIDIEGGWRFTHEDLIQNHGGIIGGEPNPALSWRNHGTSVIGEIGGDSNNFGITGISPNAFIRAISMFGPNMGSAPAIRMAADALNSGDIILIEIQRPGPKFNFQQMANQRGYIAVEWWPDDFDAIRYAINKGIIIVEAAGNGAENLDDALYDNPATGFPANWCNPFKRNNCDSGAIIVGAGAPPPGTHGQNHGPDRSRLDFSNYGRCVDAQGWGREVTTTGGSYNQAGDLQGGINEDEWYTDIFAGTSSASPIVVGTLACIQGVLHNRLLSPLTPGLARQLLLTTGSIQQDAPGRPASQRIGNRPNLRQLLSTALSIQTTALYRYYKGGEDSDHFYTIDWNELGNGALGYVFEGIQCYVSSLRLTPTIPSSRKFNPQTSGKDLEPSKFSRSKHLGRINISIDISSEFE
jgi:subtilisin family serine protease